MSNKTTIIICVVAAVFCIIAGVVIFIHVRGNNDATGESQPISIGPASQTSSEIDKDEQSDTDVQSSHADVPDVSADDYIDVIPPDDIQPTDDPDENSGNDSDVSYAIGDTSTHAPDDNSKSGEGGENSRGFQGDVVEFSDETSDNEIHLPVINF